MRYRGLTFTTDPVRAAQGMLDSGTRQVQRWSARQSPEMLLMNLAGQLRPERSYGSALAGGRTAWINPEVLRTPGLGRATVAHEAFHARHPLLGQSETLARFYEGFRSPRTAPLPRRLQSGLTTVGRYWSDPQQAYYYSQKYPRLLQGPIELAKVIGGALLPKAASASGFALYRQWRAWQEQHA